MAEAYPLHWPEGWPRTKRPEHSRFDVTLAAARDGLINEIRLMGGRYPVLSSNAELRRDGLPYARQSEPEDAGVAVYFERKGKQMVFACDRWVRIRDNVRAIQKTIEAMRGIERWGASDMLERAFSAFEALPPPGRRPWRDVLGLVGDVTLADVHRAYRMAAMKAHPDVGGTSEAMEELVRARDEAIKEAV